MSKIDNSQITVVNRMAELVNINCGNRKDKLVDNRCYSYTAPDQDPYTAQCPINYNMYINPDTNKHTCYKNCLDNTVSGEISNIDYKININGKQCLKKSFVNQ